MYGCRGVEVARGVEDPDGPYASRGAWKDGSGSFAGASEDRPPRVLSRITPPVLAGCARRGGPIRTPRGGKPSEA